MFTFANFVWHLRQLLPLTYRTHYTDAGGQKHFQVWRMWFGRVFDNEDVIVDTEAKDIPRGACCP